MGMKISYCKEKMFSAKKQNQHSARNFFIPSDKKFTRSEKTFIR
jgi:hypothetical protein